MKEVCGHADYVSINMLAVMNVYNDLTGNGLLTGLASYCKPVWRSTEWGIPTKYIGLISVPGNKVGMIYEGSVTI